MVDSLTFSSVPPSLEFMLEESISDTYLSFVVHNTVYLCSEYGTFSSLQVHIKLVLILKRKKKLKYT